MSGGIKYDSGKPRMSLLDSDWLAGVARILGFGAAKYEANNWRKGFQYSRLYDAIQRHLSAWNKGEDRDPESGESHLLHAACGLMFLYSMTLTRPELDDRYTTIVESNELPEPADLSQPRFTNGTVVRSGGGPKK